ncbi:unnamed protein product [Medioppia subpectinata]|uniref:Uncharacterized protein n=1 Tax=Medioppia subpectinata TaxID=1979941 RepID=A0A7R9QKH0_9ACAR|nr:unnamed protein product [Medioppia subpectinata]CAG2121844.1 unnamed protein product [Medioppia subpectinata]
MSKLVIIAVIVVICGVVWADFEPENRPNMRRLAPVICGSKVSDSQKKIIENCAKLLPSSVRNGYKSCVKDVLKVSKMTKPGLCYRIQPGGEKVYLNVNLIYAPR